MKNFVVIFVLVAIFACAGFVNAGEECGKNESRQPCGPACEKTCSNPNPQICPAICYLNGCTCNKGYLRDSVTKQCVRFIQCTRKKPTCV